jgi:hypothetical protein
LSLASQLFLGGITGLLGWFFFAFGMIFVWIFACSTDVPALWQFRGELESVRGQVVSVEQTSFSEGGAEHSDGTPVYAVHYRFTVGGRPYTGVSYRLGAPAEVEREVTVEYPAGKPARSRIRGLRTAPFGPVVLFVVIFPLVGAGFILGRLWTGWRQYYLLRYGELADGELVTKEPTSVSVNNQTVYKLTFAFQTSLGQPAQVAVRTHQPQRLQDDAREVVLYDPVRPSYGMTLDHLTCRPQLTEDGRVVPRSAPWALAALILPTLALLGHGTYALFRFLR